MLSRVFAVLAVLGLGALPGPARADETVQLRSFHSHRCLKPGGGVAECGPATELRLERVGGDAVMIRSAHGNDCMYSNKDGRFAWYGCNPQYTDQHWILSHEPGAPGEVRGFEMVRSFHSGRCLYSNADGRFGLYACTAGFTDQYWRAGGHEREPEVVREPPREFEREREHHHEHEREHERAFEHHEARRDCGAADNQGCAELRDGQPPMDRETWGGYFGSLKGTANELTRADMAKSMFEHNYLTARQFTQLLNLFNNELTRMDVATAGAGRVVDPKRALGYGERFRNSFTRQDYLDLIGKQ